MSIYTDNGYEGRYHYLRQMGEAYGVPEHVVYMLADLLGEDEDFDGLISSLQDWNDLGMTAMILRGDD